MLTRVFLFCLLLLLLLHVFAEMILLAKLKPLLLETYHASGYMCGHDHCQERIDEGKGPVCVLSGSGFECCYPGTNAHKVPEGAIKMAYWLGECPEGAECPNNKAASLATGKAAFQRL